MEGQPRQAPTRPDAPVLRVPGERQHLQPQAGEVTPGHRPAQGHRHLVHRPPAGVGDREGGGDTVVTPPPPQPVDSPREGFGGGVTHRVWRCRRWLMNSTSGE